MNYGFYTVEILLIFILIVASIGYLIGSVLLRKKVRPEYVVIGSGVYLVIALLYLTMVYGKWSRTLTYENPIFWYSTFVIMWSLPVVLFVNLTYAIMRLKLKYSRQRV